jgi:hypothetical protein
LLARATKGGLVAAASVAPVEAYIATQEPDYTWSRFNEAMAWSLGLGGAFNLGFGYLRRAQMAAELDELEAATRAPVQTMGAA